MMYLGYVDRQSSETTQIKFRLVYKKKEQVLAPALSFCILTYLYKLLILDVQWRWC